MTPERLQELLDSFADRRVAVLGDFFLDKYFEIDPTLGEISLETGRPVHQVVKKMRAPSAGGSVVNHLRALGAAEIHALGAIGDDGDAFDLCKCLEALDCTTHGLLRCHELTTPTSLKTRDVGVPGLVGEHARYESKNRRPTPSTITSHLAAALGHVLANVDALVIVDQVEQTDCGVVTSALRDILTEQAQRHPQVLFWADSRRHVRQFRRIVTKPNQFEALGRFNPLPGDEVSKTDLWAAIPRLRSETHAPVFVTWAEHGIVVSDPEPQLIPGVKLKGPLETAGVGSSVTAGAVLTLTSGGSHAEAALMANLYAAVTMQQPGSSGPARVGELPQALQRWRDQNNGIAIGRNGSH